MESGKAPGVTVVLSESARTRVYVTVTPDETYELPGGQVITRPVTLIGIDPETKGASQRNCPL